jgi:hypothetical protein
MKQKTETLRHGSAGILMVAMMGLAATGVMAAPSGLTHHWAFDEGPDWHDSAFQSVCTATTALDSVGAADAALMNMTSADWVSGRQFTALDFDGVDDYLESAEDLAATLGGTASLSFWIKTTQVGGSVGADAPGVMGTEATGTTDDIQWGWIDASGRICLSVKGTENVVRSTAAINDGQWRHIVFTRNSSTGACQIYVDGALGTPGTGPTGTTTAAFYGIGRIEDPMASTPRYLAGRLDQIHVFNTVIDQTMVTQLRDNHAPKTWDTQTNGTNTPFSTASVLFCSYDPEQDALSVFSFSQPSHGSVTSNGDGTFTYTANPGFVGADSFGVTIEDGKGGFCDTVMSIVVQAPPADPDAGKRTTTFTNFAAIQAGGADISLNGFRVPRAMDWDGDGDKDLLIGHDGTVWLYVNDGTVSAPVFAAGVKVQANSSDIALSGSTGIALADMTGDGVDDLVAVDTTRKIRVYRNTSAAGATPVYAAATIVKDSGGADFVLPDQRFDVAFWDSDGLPDVVMGSWGGECRAYKNVGAASDPRYDPAQYELCESGAYNLYPRVFDINRNGTPDYVRGINWGSIDYWFDPVLYEGMGTRSGSLTITYSDGTSVDVRTPTDGAIVDFADYNGDGAYDILIGGHYGTGVYLATGVPKTVAQSIADVEAIYDAHPSDLGAALEADGQQHLNEVKAAERNIIAHMFSGLLPERQTMFAQMTAHVQKYSFLQMGSPLSLPLYHHVPSIAGQNLMTMHQMLPDTPTHRANVATALGLTGLWRTIYLNTALHVGDNQHCSQGQLESIRDVMACYPRTALFPDTVLTIDGYFGDGGGGTVNVFTSAKNTFGTDTGYNELEQSFASDCVTAIESFYGARPELGDYFTFVMGHEVTHSVDGYVNRRKNTDLRRRWGQVLTYAAGPEVVTSNNDQYGWWDWTATKAKFLADGYWDGVEANWAAAYAAYWTTGPGSAWRNLSFMRGGIDWFLAAPQESLATQANQSWAGGEPRLIGATDRYRRGVETGPAPLKANINEVVTFLDFTSAGLNKMVLLDTTGVMTPYPHAQYTNDTAWLERDDKGYITRVTVSTGRIFDLTYEPHGIVTAVQTNLYTIADDSFGADSGQPAVLDVLSNDHRLEGGGVSSFTSYTQPSHGTLINNGYVTLTYTSTGGYKGLDSFTYTVGAKTATVTIAVGGLTAHWPLDETSGTVADDSVGARDGTYLGGVALGQSGATVNTANAISLDGADDSVQVPSLNLNTNTVTVTGWIRKNGAQPAWAGIFFCRAGNTMAGLDFGGNQELRYHWNNENYGWNSGLVVPDAAWTFVALVVEPARATIYMNTGSGMQSAVNTAAHTAEEFNGVAYLGWDTNSGSRRFKGLMDDFRVYDRILSAAEITALYNEYVGANNPPVWNANPIVEPNATAGAAYTGTIADHASDPDTGDTITISKVSGPEWLTVGTDGALSGTPGAGDAGLNTFTVKVSDGKGGENTAGLSIRVVILPPARARTWVPY